MITKNVLEQRFERFLEIARRHDLKLTQQRLEIFRALAGREDHPSAEEIHKQLLRRLPTLSLDTVYRTLWTFRELGIIGSLSPHIIVARFDANHSHHHHFVCERCGSIQDYENLELNAITVPADLAGLGQAQTLHVEIRGLCRSCMESQAGITKSAKHPKGDKHG